MTSSLSRTVTLRLALNIKDWVTKPNHDNGNQDDAKGYWRGDIFEFEIFAVLDDGLAGAVVNKSENSKDNGQLRDADAGVAKGVNDGPGMAKPGDFGEDQATGEGSKEKIVIVGLDKHVAGGGIADEESDEYDQD